MEYRTRYRLQNPTPRQIKQREWSANYSDRQRRETRKEIINAIKAADSKLVHSCLIEMLDNLSTELLLDLNSRLIRSKIELF